ncbi:glycoside hydrolase superfamily [Aspergillus foveolatus]|uniref:glycoside hydrolase superfamily n=1 Tax=Aspergillus foveolatus TaxID=210207 RepID=UPI003CCCD996
MAFFTRILGAVAGFTVLQSVYAGLDLSSNSTVVVYWGQNSFRGTGDLAQQRLGKYCEDSNIDVIVLAFLMTINGPGGAPEIDFSISSEGCTTFSGTNLKNCPEIGEDITKCQAAGKTILLSIGGATYSEGGFASADAANAGADLLWATFGPDQNDTKIHRPFGSAVIDGFDFDFEAAVANTAVFATRLRALAVADTSKKYYLTAAPQCPYPDAADKDILNTNSSAAIDAVFVQFYNNYCGVNAYAPARNIPAGARSKAGYKLRAREDWYGRPHRSSDSGNQAAASNFNFDVWDNWALTQSKNKKVRVFLGVPANTGAASMGYLPATSLEPVISYSKGFESFGGVMMWDVSQAYGNPGFLDGVAKALGKGLTAHVPVQESPQQQQQVANDDAQPSSAQQGQDANESMNTVPPLQQQQEAGDQGQAPAQQGQDANESVDASPPLQSPPLQQQQNADDEGQTSSAQQSQDGDAPVTTGPPLQQEGAIPTAPQMTTGAGEQQLNQDQGDDQDRPLDFLPSLLDPDDDLDWIQI